MKKTFKAGELKKTTTYHCNEKQSLQYFIYISIINQELWSSVH